MHKIIKKSNVRIKKISIKGGRISWKQYRSVELWAQEFNT